MKDFSDSDQDALLADFDKAIKLDPANPVTYNNRGIAKCRLNQLEAAMSDFDKAIELKPDAAIAYNNRGKTSS